MNAGVAMNTLLAGVMFFTSNSFAFLVYERSKTISTDKKNIHLVSSHVEGFLFEDEKESDEKLFEEYVFAGSKDVAPAIFNFYRETMVATAL
jgi:hypothetical protein